MAKAYQTNTKVHWQWGNGTAEGYVRGVFKEKITKTIKGSDITRNASDDDPAYLIEQADGAEVLKLHSEVSKSN